MAASTIDWDTTNTSSLITLDTGSQVHLATYGPPRSSSNEAVLLILPGVGGSSLQFPALIRALPFISIFIFDRPGHGLSPRSANPPSLENIVADMHAMLRATNVKPPHITLGHSWGGMLSAAFAASLLHTPGAIRGMIIMDAPSPSIDCEHEDFTTDPNTPWSHQCVRSAMSGLEILTITHPPEDTALTTSEYSALQAPTQTPEFQEQIMREFTAAQQSYRPFADSQYFHRNPPLLSGTPVVTIHAHSHEGYERIYQESVIKGTGSEADREAFKALLPTWHERGLISQKQFLTLTDPENQLSIMAKPGTGHVVQIMDVESCVQAVKWVLMKSGYKEGPRGKDPRRTVRFGDCVPYQQPFSAHTRRTNKSKYMFEADSEDEEVEKCSDLYTIPDRQIRLERALQSRESIDAQASLFTRLFGESQKERQTDAEC